MEFRFMLGDSKVDVRKQEPILGGCCPSWGIGIIFLYEEGRLKKS